eukprot:233270-Pelagomonas_calceolata.AAC.1
MKSRLTSSSPDAILITSNHDKPTSAFYCSHHVICSRRMTLQRTSTANRVRQPHQLNANERHVHPIKIKYCEDKRPGQQLEAAKWRHTGKCKNVSGRAVAIHIILLGVGGTCYNEDTKIKPNIRPQPPTSWQACTKTICTLCKGNQQIVTIRHAIETRILLTAKF